MKNKAVTSLAIHPLHEMPPDQIEALEEALYTYNAERTGHTDGAGLAFVADDNGERIGAVAGYTWAGMAELRQVWVREDWRGHDLGRRLMEAALAEARVRGCRTVFLATYEFQARGFYETLGFACVAEIPEKPPGHSEFVLCLKL